VTETIFAFWVTTTERNEYIEFKAWSRDVKEEFPFMMDDLGNKYTADEPKDPNDLIDHPSRRWHVMTYPWRGKNMWSDLTPPAHIVAFAKTLPPTFAGGSGTVSFSEARADWLDFQPVAQNAKKITILLPARNVEGEGILRFMFDVEKVRAMVKPQG
jgi:hypothetical protein